MKIALTTAVMTLLILVARPLLLEAANAAIDGTVARDSYSLGYQIGMDLKLKGNSVDPAAMSTGVADGLDGSEPALDPQEMNQLLIKLKKTLVAAQKDSEKKVVEGYRGEGREFLDQNSSKEGIVTLPSGLQYKVLTKGAGKTPGPTDGLILHYEGKTTSGQPFYNSRSGDGKPDTVQVNGVVKGLSEGLQLMKEGGRRILYLPADLAYGERGPLADRVVIFDVELISIVTGE